MAYLSYILSYIYIYGLIKPHGLLYGLICICDFVCFIWAYVYYYMVQINHIVYGLLYGYSNTHDRLCILPHMYGLMYGLN